MKQYSQCDVWLLWLRLPALVNVGRCTHTAATEVRKGRQIVTDELNRRVPFHVRPVRRKQVGVGHQSDLDEESSNWAIGYTTEKRSQRNGDKAKSQGDSPLATANMGNLERSTADKNNQNLDANFYQAEQVNYRSAWNSSVFDIPIKVMNMK